MHSDLRISNKSMRRECSNLLRRLSEVSARDADENFDVGAKAEREARIRTLRDELLGDEDEPSTPSSR